MNKIYLCKNIPHFSTHAIPIRLFFRLSKDWILVKKHTNKQVFQILNRNRQSQKNKKQNEQN
jgi:hypothetical protein